MADTGSETGAALEEALHLLQTRFGHAGFLPGQEQALESAFAGRNLLVVMPTGSGKSLVYQLPSLVDEGLTIVVSPLISLMKNQVDELSRIGVPATAVNSSLGRDEQRARLAGCAKGEFRLLYIAPERCRDASFIGMMRGIRVSRLAVDEAHCISEWGHDFRPDYRRLEQFHERIGRPPVTALTATATGLVQADIIESLGLDRACTDVHVHGFDRPNLVLGVQRTPSNEKKMEFLSGFLRTNPGSGIIYTGTRRSAEDIVASLGSVESGMVAYHAGMPPEDRGAAQEAFLSGKARVVAATSAFGMGIDKRDVRFVVHYSFPGSVEQYYQEVGRAGRDGLPSRCVLLYSSADRGLREFFIDIGFPDARSVRSVYEAIWATGDNPLLMTYKEIARSCDEQVSEGQVGTAVRLLDGAGVLRAWSGEPKVALTLKRPLAEISPRVRGPLQRKVLEALASSADLETPGRFEIGLDSLASDAGVSPEQVRRALSALAEAGLAGYEPPFRGRGIQKLVEPAPHFKELAIDWKRHEALRGMEEKKLAAMERFIQQRGCRRGYILSYFGESRSFECGTCDCCGNAPSTDKEKVGAIERYRTVALPVLACLRFLEFPIGKGRVAEVVTGSRRKEVLEWRLDRNPAYGLVDARQPYVREVIEQLIVEGYIEQESKSGLPVLGLTELGREEASALTCGQLKSLAANEANASQRSGAAGGARDGGAGGGAGREAKRGRGLVSSTTDIRYKVLKCIDSVPFGIGVTKIAAVLTGTRAAWTSGTGVSDLDVFRSVNATQEQLRDIIKAMLAEGLIAREGSPHRPTLGLTGKGRAELERLPG